MMERMNLRIIGSEIILVVAILEFVDCPSNVLPLVTVLRRLFMILVNVYLHVTLTGTVLNDSLLTLTTTL